MRFTSSGRKFLSFLLSLVLLRSTGAVPPVMAASPPEPCILLKLSDVSIPADTVKSGMDALEGLLEEDLHIRWVTPVPAEEAGQEADEALPVADGKALNEISAALGDATRFMDRMDTKEAAEKLSEAETIARSYRFGDTTRPFLAEVFLRKGILYLWEGEAGKAEEMLARSRVLRPDFDPDPAMYSPLFLEAWKRSGERPPPRAELLVSSLPPGAKIYRNGEEVGTTPARVRISEPGTVRLRVLAEGYLQIGWAGQMLPGDSEALEFPLVRDRNAALAEIVSSSPDGKEAGPAFPDDSRNGCDAGCSPSARAGGGRSGVARHFPGPGGRRAGFSGDGAVARRRRRMRTGRCVDRGIAEKRGMAGACRRGYGKNSVVP